MYPIESVCIPKASKGLGLLLGFVLLACAAPALAADVTDVTLAAPVTLAASENALASWPVETSSPHRILAGAFFEHNSAWEPGIAVSYANREFLDGRPRVQLTYATTRLYAAAGSNTLKEDRLRLLAGWYFREGQRVNPSLSLGLGYTHFDYEDDALALLDNDGFGALLQTHLEVSLFAGLRAYGALGYEIVSSPTVYPISLGFGLNYDLGKVLP